MPVRAPDVAHSATGRCFISRTATGREATCIFRSTCNIYIHIVLILLLEIRDLYIIYYFFFAFPVAAVLCEREVFTSITVRVCFFGGMMANDDLDVYIIARENIFHPCTVPADL